MKKFLVLSLTLVSFLAFAQVAEAKRFGFGGSFGYSKQMKPQQFGSRPSSPAYNTPKSAPKSATNSAPAKSGASRWLGPLAGLAAGGLIASMLFGDGFSGIHFFDIVVLLILAFVLTSLFKRRQPQEAYEPYSSTSSGSAVNHQSVPSAEPVQTFSTYQNAESEGMSSNGSIIGSDLSDSAETGVHAPNWFDEKSFLENAKSHFEAVQKAWDALDLTEIREYCTPELAASLEVEIANAEMANNFTQVDELKAAIADMAIDGDYFIVSVRFSGFIVEEQGGFAHAFNEIWHIRRLAQGEGNWQIAGIQQA